MEPGVLEVYMRLRHRQTAGILFLVLLLQSVAAVAVRAQEAHHLPLAVPVAVVVLMEA